MSDTEQLAESGKAHERIDELTTACERAHREISRIAAQ